MNLTYDRKKNQVVFKLTLIIVNLNFKKKNDHTDYHLVILKVLNFYHRIVFRFEEINV